jgi:hypothetical protein
MQEAMGRRSEAAVGKSKTLSEKYLKKKVLEAWLKC